MINFSTITSPFSRATIGLLTCLSVLTTGCAVTQQTRQSLAGYVHASDQIRLTADDLLADFSNRSKAEVERQRLTHTPESPAAAYPAKFYPAGDPNLKPTEAEKFVTQTQQALVVIREYNDVLVALAEGRGDKEVREQTEAFGGALQDLLLIVGQTIPGLSLATAVGAKIVKLAQDATNRDQLVQAVSQGREPVGTILKHLKAQTSALYELTVQGTDQGQRAARKAIQRAATALAALSALHAPPLDPAIATQMAALQAQAGDVARKTMTGGAVTIPFPFVAGKPVADAAVFAEAEIFLQSMRASAQKYAELVAAQNAYYDVMGHDVGATQRT